MKVLNASHLKNALWETLDGIKSGRIQPGEGDAIAAQAREILRTIKTQLQVAAQSNRVIAKDVVDFAENVDVGAARAQRKPRRKR